MQKWYVRRVLHPQDFVFETKMSALHHARKNGREAGFCHRNLYVQGIDDSFSTLPETCTANLGWLVGHDPTLQLSQSWVLPLHHSHHAKHAVHIQNT